MVEDVFSRFKRPVPQWYVDAKLGFMVSWGAFSVPAWGEPIGELGTISDWKHWFKHNPYPEWYYNTIRIEGSPASQYHREKFNNCPYDDLLDQADEVREEKEAKGETMDGLPLDVIQNEFKLSIKYREGMKKLLGEIHPDCE